MGILSRYQTALNSFLATTLTVRQLIRGVRRLFFFALAFYLVALFIHDWNREMGGVAHRDSPYWNEIPVECRASALWAGMNRTERTANEWLLLEPPSFIYSLPQSEKKLGFGMRGFPCMGYDFLMVLHGTNYKRINKFVNEDGEVAASITIEVLKPYRPPVSQAIWSERSNWPEIDNPPSNDSSLVRIPVRSVK